MVAVNAATGAMYAAIGSVGLVSNELWPLYVLNDRAHGGFGWDSSAVGLAAFAAGPFLIVFQAGGYERVVRRLGLVRLLRWCLGAWALCLASQPLCSLALLGGEALQYGVVYTHFIATNLCRTTAFICVFVFVANSALPEDRGKVNGLGQAMVSAVRAVSPPLGTAAFAWSVSAGNTAAGWPVDFHLTWYALAALALATLALTHTLPPWIAGKRPAHLRAA